MVAVAEGETERAVERYKLGLGAWGAVVVLGLDTTYTVELGAELAAEQQVADIEELVVENEARAAESRKDETE